MATEKMDLAATRGARYVRSIRHQEEKGSEEIADILCSVQPVVPHFACVVIPRGLDSTNSPVNSSVPL
jgi:hypothetical protein